MCRAEVLMLAYAQVGASAYSPAGTDNHYVVYLNTGEPHARPERARRGVTQRCFRGCCI
jgi:hypothetical protein